MEIKNSFILDLSKYSDYLESVQNFIKCGLKTDLQKLVRTFKFVEKKNANLVNISSFRFSTIFVVIFKVTIDLSEQDEFKLKDYAVKRIQGFIHSLQKVDTLGVISKGMPIFGS